MAHLMKIYDLRKRHWLRNILWSVRLARIRYSNPQLPVKVNWSSLSYIENEMEFEIAVEKNLRLCFDCSLHLIHLIIWLQCITDLATNWILVGNTQLWRSEICTIRTLYYINDSDMDGIWSVFLENLECHRWAKKCWKMRKS